MSYLSVRERSRKLGGSFGGAPENGSGTRWIKGEPSRPRLHSPARETSRCAVAFCRTRAKSNRTDSCSDAPPGRTLAYRAAIGARARDAAFARPHQRLTRSSMRRHLTVPPDVHLTLLRRLDRRHAWESLNDRRHCVACGKLIRGHEIQIYRSIGGIGPLRLRCPSERCRSGPLEWVLPSRAGAAEMCACHAAYALDGRRSKRERQACSRSAASPD